MADKRNGILTDYVVYYTNDASLPMSVWERATTADDSISLTGLSIFTEYTVSVAASTAAGVGPYSTVELRTLNDSKMNHIMYLSLPNFLFSLSACSEPIGVAFTDIGETTVDLTWTESATRNGIISGYMVHHTHTHTDLTTHTSQ